MTKENDTTMVVTLTVGEIFTLMREAATEAAEKAVSEVLCRMAAVDERNADADVLIGGEAIAKALGVNRNTMYKLRREGVLGDAVRQMGSGKLIATRSELLNAIKERRSA